AVTGSACPVVRSLRQSEAPVSVLSTQRELARSDRRWPLESFLALGAFPGAVPCARLHVRQVLWEWRLGDMAETVELLVSELTTNALRASEGFQGSRYAGRWIPGVPPVRLWLLSGRHRVVVEVWDGNR